jgi:hypothetical protein
MNMKFGLLGSKVSVALLLISVLVSTSAMANLIKTTKADCGIRGGEESTDSAFCNYSGSYFSVPRGASFDYRIVANAATGYVFGGLRTLGGITFNGLLDGRVGATDFSPASAISQVQYEDRFRFNFSNAIAGETLTMKTLMRFHGNNYENVDESLFKDGNTAFMSSDFRAGGFGVPEFNQMASFLSVADGLVTPAGSSDVINLFTRSITVNTDNGFNDLMSLRLTTQVFLRNNFLGSTGVGSGAFGADFSSTAGVLSIEFFDSQNRLVDYQLTTDTGLFSFLRAAPPVSVPAPSAIGMMLLGFCALVGFKRRRLTVSAAARTL